MNQKITTHPHTAMELAWNRAVQKRAVQKVPVPKQPGKVPKNPPEVACMVFECVGTSTAPITGPQLRKLAIERGWDITPEFAVKAAKWHTDYLKAQR